MPTPVRARTPSRTLAWRPCRCSVDIDRARATSATRATASFPCTLLSTPTFDATTVDHTTVTFGDASETHVDKKTGVAKRHDEDVNGDGDDRPRVPLPRSTRPDCRATRRRCRSTGSPSTASRSPPAARTQRWSATSRSGRTGPGPRALDFWYYGAGGGDEITVTLKDNRAPDPGPAGWTLAWADEFDDPAGTPPNPANWAYEIGDTTPDGKNGWGNEELQYYTDDPANAATDGNGNLVITLDEADGSQECYYGPCEFESARLITQNKAEFAYGRIESRLQVPDRRRRPVAGVLEPRHRHHLQPVARCRRDRRHGVRQPYPERDLRHDPRSRLQRRRQLQRHLRLRRARSTSDYHTFTVEWEPDLITWYVDGIQYHQAEPSDVPGPWVFEKPFFLLLNFAIGGNFGGAIDPANTYPQEYLVDYVRVYQGPDTAERFETTFTDSVAGWQQVSIPITDFVRSADQPAGAPNDGLGLDEVWGYGFAFPNGTASGEARFDFVQRVPIPPPTELVVTNLDDSGPGSLREALALIADGGTITFDPSLWPAAR